MTPIEPEEDNFIGDVLGSFKPTHFDRMSASKLLSSIDSNVSFSLNYLDGGYIGDYIGDYHRAY